MRGLLLGTIISLLFGALSIWLMQQDGGYVFVHFQNYTVEMTVWVALLLYLIVTASIVWFFLLVKWGAGAGGLRNWWVSRASRKKINTTKQGLILYADHEWQRALEVLTKSAERSLIPEVDLLFAVRSASECGQIEKARSLIEKLKVSNSKIYLLAQKSLAEIYIQDESFDLALDIITPMADERPEDPRVLRLLADVLYLTEDWTSLQLLLQDMHRFKALHKSDMALLEFDVYQNLLSEFQVDPDLTLQEQKAQVDDLWDIIPKRLKTDSYLTCFYFDLLVSVNNCEKMIPTIIKNVNNNWNDEMVLRLGEAGIPKPEVRLAAAENWLVKNPENAILLFTLGNICCQLKFWGKARDYFSSALAIEPNPKIFASLGEVMIQIGEVDAAHDAFRRGLILGNQEGFSR